MKTRSWIILYAALFALLLGLVLAQSLAQPAAQAELLSDGRLLYTLDLRQDAELTVEYGGGWNRVEVREGKISVTAASCPEQDCVRCGAKNSGAPIVCLPNRLTIRFVDNELDGVVQ